MAAATDFVHDEAVMQAWIDVLNATLPATWRDDDNPIFGLKVLQMGHLRDYNLVEDETWDSLCPGILIRPFRTTIEGFAIGGVEQDTVPIRIVHIWNRDQCYDADTDDMLSPIVSQVRRAKTLVKSLLKDTSGDADRSLSAASLTTDDTSALVLQGSARVTGVWYEGQGIDFPTISDRFSVVVDTEVRVITS